ncbi:glycosyltransferase [Dongia mobilis]|nr:glycosyltransferase [Dongia mobilis]
MLFVHRDYPGQFGAIAAGIARSPHHRVVFMNSVQAGSDGDITLLRTEPRRRPAPTTHHYLHSFEADVLMGQAIYMACARLRDAGFTPDVILAHCGWGVALYLREVFPRARLIGYFEWFYHPHDSDADYLKVTDLALLGVPLGGMSPDKACRIRTLNAPILMALEDVDYGVVPTNFQRRVLPDSYQHKLTTLHDGVDTDFFRPDPAAPRCIGEVDFTGVSQLVTYATRGLEPYRGFPHFMQAINGLLRRDKSVHVAIAGEDRAFYSRALPNGETYRERMLRMLPDLPLERVHFLGTLPRAAYRSLLQISSLHVYLTVPFVPSWSLVEAMACGCHIVAADTAPVREVVSGTDAAELVDFRDVLQLEEVMACALRRQEAAEDLRRQARKRAESGFSQVTLLPRWEALLLGEGDGAAASRITQV